MKKHPKSTRDTVSREQVNNALYTMLGAVGSSVEFNYNNRNVKGVLLNCPLDGYIELRLEKDYIGAQVDWGVGETKQFDSRVVYNFNCT